MLLPALLKLSDDLQAPLGTRTLQGFVVCLIVTVVRLRGRLILNLSKLELLAAALAVQQIVLCPHIYICTFM